MTETQTIEWDDENTGMLTNENGSSSRIYKLNYAIECEIYDYCRLLINNPTKWNSETPSVQTRYNSFSPLNSCYPKISYNKIGRIHELFNEIIPNKLKEICSKNNIKDDTLDNFLFLALLGQIRNWKDGCAICLTDKIMGTTCGCGHTEIVIFRPCGHALCGNPCFATFIEKFKSQSLNEKIIVAANGQRFKVVGGLNYETSLHFDCPLCRTEVTRTFQAEEVNLTGLKEHILEWTNLIVNSLDE